MISLTANRQYFHLHKQFRMKIGLYFGTFNPIHIGHMAIANYMIEFSEIEQLWFVVSPQNPFKTKSNLLADIHRLRMVRFAIEDDERRFKACNIEFGLPKPSYTIDTLIYLKDKYPEHEFFLIIGSDNLEYFQKWKNYEMILENGHLLVYPRPGYDPGKWLEHPKIEMVDAPLIEISSSFIRKTIHKGKDIRHFLPFHTWEYLDKMNFYRSKKNKPE